MGFAVSGFRGREGCMNMKTVSAVVSNEVHQAIKDLALLNGISMNKQMESILMGYIQDHREKIGKAQGFLREWKNEK